MRKSLVFIFLIMMLMCGSASATDYYVSPSGSDSNDGLSTGASFLTIQTGANALSAGDTLYLMGGVWYDNETTFSASGTSNSPITITAYPGASPVLQGNLSKYENSDYICFDNGNGYSYITISDIEIYDYRAGFYADSGVADTYSNIMLDNLTIHDIYRSAVAFDPFHDNCSVLNCNFYDNDLSGDGNMVGVYGTYPDKPNGTYSRNFLINNTWIHGHIDHSAIDLFGEMEHITVTHNNIDNSSIYYHTTPTDDKGRLLYANISYNDIDTPAQYGINVLTKDSYLIGNTINGTSSDSIYLPTYSNSTTYFRPENNTLKDNICDDGIKITGFDSYIYNNTASSYGIYPYNDTVFNAGGSSYVVSRNSEPGTIPIVYDDGRVTTNTRNLPITFYPTNSTFTVSTLFTTVTTYDLFLQPSSGYLDSLSTLNPSGDRYSFSITASEDSLSTDISAIMEDAELNYTIAIDGVQAGDTTSDSTGLVSFTVDLDATAQTVVIEQVSNLERSISQVSMSSDDAYESGTGYFSSTLSTLNVQSYTDNTSGDYNCGGLRFQNVTLPDNAIIEGAYIKFYLESSTYDNADMLIYANDVDDAVTYSSASSETKVIDRTRTTNFTSWTEDGIALGWSNSPDIKDVILEVTSREGWNSGNNISIQLIGNVSAKKTFRAVAYDDDPSYAPKLVIEYSIPNPPEVLSYSPESDSTSTYGDNHEFVVYFTQDVNATWYIDSIEVQTNTSVTTASYSNSTAPVGTYNVTVIGYSGDESVQQSWEWTVTTAPVPSDLTMLERAIGDIETATQLAGVSIVVLASIIILTLLAAVLTFNLDPVIAIAGSAAVVIASVFLYIGVVMLSGMVAPFV